MPALNIPVKVNLDDFRKGMNEAKSSVSSGAEFIAKEFVKMNISAAKVVAPPALAAIGAALPPLVSAFGPMLARLAAFKIGLDLVEAAVGGARAELVELVAIADKASNLNVSPAFFQGFLSESHGLKVSAEELEGALTHAFDATKEKSPIDLSKWEIGKDRITDVEAALRIYNETLAKTAGTQLKGLVLFRDADSQEQKIKAVLLAMVQLKDIGQEAAALDIGAKMFGSTFVDRIRQGKTSAESILSSMKAAAAADDGIFSNTLVIRAKAVDDQLKLSQDRLSRGLKPSWDDLAGSLLTIKGYWADVVDLIGKAVDWTNKLGLTSERTKIKNELGDVNDAVKNGTGLFGLPQVPESVTSALGMQSPQDRLKARQQRLQAQLDEMDRGVPEGPAVPKPSRGTGDKPTLKATDTAKPERDPFDVSIDATEKRIAALKAETATIGDATAVRERAKTVATLEEAAKRANTAAGLENTAVTDKQRAAIDKEADAMMRATSASEKAKITESIKVTANTSLLSPEDAAIAEKLKTIYPDVATALNSVEAAGMRTNDAMKTVAGSIQGGLVSSLTDIVDHTKPIGASFASMSRSVIRSIDEMLIRMLVVAPIMRTLESSFGGLNLFGGGAAATPAAQFAGGTMPMADGGFVSGPGSSRSDSIPARLSNGEFVINANSTSKHRGLLESINGGSLRGFADGGLVSNVPSMPSTTQIGGQTTHISPSINVTVQGQAGQTPAQHAEMGAAIARAAQESMQAMVGSELRKQMRPGGILRS